MNITSPNGNFTESPLQSAYVKPMQVTSDIAEREKNKPQQINASTETHAGQKLNAKGPYDEAYSLQPTECPADEPINVPVPVVLSRALADELRQFPDIDHAKVADLMEQLNSGNFAISNDLLADSMMNFYQSWK